MVKTFISLSTHSVCLIFTAYTSPSLIHLACNDLKWYSSSHEFKTRTQIYRAEWGGIVCSINKPQIRKFYRRKSMQHINQKF